MYVLKAKEFNQSSSTYSDVVRFLRQRAEERHNFISMKMENYQNFELCKKNYCFFLEKDKSNMIQPIENKEKEPILIRILKTKELKRGRTPDLIKPREYFQKLADDILEEGNMNVHNSNFQKLKRVIQFSNLNMDHQDDYQKLIQSGDDIKVFHGGRYFLYTY